MLKGLLISFSSFFFKKYEKKTLYRFELQQEMFQKLGLTIKDLRKVYWIGEHVARVK